jgi:hypothetical protein
MVCQLVVHLLATFKQRLSEAFEVLAVSRHKLLSFIYGEFDNENMRHLVVDVDGRRILVGLCEPWANAKRVERY